MLCRRKLGKVHCAASRHTMIAYRYSYIGPYCPGIGTISCVFNPLDAAVEERERKEVGGKKVHV